MKKPSRSKPASDPDTVSTLFGPVRVSKDDEPLERPNQFSIFKFIQDINYDKQYLYDDNTKSEYKPWIVNVSMSMFPDTLAHAAFLNLNAGLDAKMQHDYLFYAVQKRKRFKKDGWFKKSDAEKRELKVLEDVARTVCYSMAHTKQFWSMLTDQQKRDFLERYVYPDSKNSKK